MGYFSDLFLRVFTILYRGGVRTISECRISSYSRSTYINSQGSYETKKGEQRGGNVENEYTIYDVFSFFSF
jgi:hypothetical protein